MDTAIIRKQLHEYIEVAADKKLEAIYTLLEDEIEPAIEYAEEVKAELGRRLDYYLNGGKMVTPDEMNSRLKSARAKTN